MKERLKRWQERTREPSLRALLIVEVLLILVAIPLGAKDLVPSAVVTLMLALFLSASFLVAARSRVAMVIFAASVVLAQTAALAHSKHWSPLTAWFDAGARHTAICAVSWVILRVVFAPGPITVHRIEAAVVLYLNIALFFFTTYRFVLILAPDAFSYLTIGEHHSPSASDLLYFSLAALIGTSYPAITPTTPLAHGLVKMESLICLLYLAALLAWFIILQLKQRRSRG
jgi:hypothetical protein